MRSETSPTARALRTLEVLQTSPVVTADDLGRRLDVSGRAARRYIAILREAGIPVESARGPYGGYRLGRGALLAPVVFTPAEALSLVMAVIDSHPSVASDGQHDEVSGALDKVIRALPATTGQQATALRRHATAAPDRRANRPDPAITSALVSASTARRCVEVSYRSESGASWETEADPWAVVVRHSRWYLLCRSHRADAVRTYRIDRIGGVRETEEYFEMPEGLDPVASLEEHLGIGWEFGTRVVFDAPPGEVQHWVHPAMGRVEPHPRGCVLVGSTSNPAMYAEEWLSRIPLSFRVEGGPELLSAVAVVVDRLAAGTLPPEAASVLPSSTG